MTRDAQIADVGLFGSMGRYGDLGMHVVLDLRRSFTREELTAAMEAAIRAFPVLGRRYAPGFWRDRWVAVDRPVAEAVHVPEPPLGPDVQSLVRRSGHNTVKCQLDDQPSGSEDQQSRPGEGAHSTRAHRHRFPQ